MAIIDEEGRLFGTVNVVDALVVLVVLAVAVAGFALIAGSGETSRTETRYATLDFGLQPEYVIGQLEVGDTWNHTDSIGNVTVTDTYLTRSGSQASALARVAVTGPVTDGQFTFDGEPLRLGRVFRFQTDTYVLNGTIRAIGSGSELPVGERTVVLRGTVPAEVAGSVEGGDEVRVGGETIATFQDVAVYDATGANRRTLYVAATLRTVQSGGESQFAGTPVEVGQELTLPVAGYQYNGTIERVGDGFDRQTESILVTGVVDAATAEKLSTGDTYTVAEQDVATVESVAVYGTEEPDRKRVYVGLSVQTLRYGNVSRFGSNRSLRDGVVLTFRTPSYEFQSEVVRLGTLTQPGETTERTVTLRMENVPPERANSVEKGLTETNAGQTVARVVGVQVEPAVVTLTSDGGNIYEREHPVNKDVTLTLELRVRERPSGVRFKGGLLQENDEVVIDLGTTTIRATVADLNGT